MKKGKISLKLLSAMLVMILVLGASLAFTGCIDEGEYVPDEYTITYSLDGGTNHTDNPDTYNADVLPLVIKEPTKQGYIFLGWKSEINIEAQPLVTITKSTRKNLNFTATWEIIPVVGDGEYSIMYVFAAGTNHSANPSKYTADDLPLTIQEPTRDGYEFLGWTSALNAENQKTVTIPKDTEQGLVFTAHWELIGIQRKVEPAGYGVGKVKAPDFEVTKIDKNGNAIGTVKLSDYYGIKPVFISFWAYWCGPCLTEMKNHFNPLYQEMSDVFELMAVHASVKTELVSHLSTNNYTFPIFDDESETAIGKGYAYGYIPANYMVDIFGYLYNPNNPNSTVVNKFNLGTMSSEKMMKIIINAALARGQ